MKPSITRTLAVDALQGLFAYGRRGPGIDENPTSALTGGTDIYAHAAGTATRVERERGTRLRIDMR